MKILAVNVNTTAAMTEQIADAARAVVREGTEIVGVTPRVGAESVEGNFESYLCAVAVMDSVATYPDAFDAVIQCGFGEHGVEGLREIVDVPVVDMTEAAAHFAMLLGNRFTIVTTLDRAVPLIEERLLINTVRMFDRLRLVSWSWKIRSVRKMLFGNKRELRSLKIMPK